MFRYRDMRSLDDVIGRAYAFLKKGGWRSEARPLLDEFYELDKVCLLAELRVLMLDAGYSLDVVARFDR